MLCLFTIAATLALAQAEIRYEVGDTVVAVWEAPLSEGGRTVGHVSPGLVLRVTDCDGQRLRISAEWAGWIDRRDILPLDLAARYFTDAILARPTDPDLYRARGCAWYALQNYGPAIEDFSEAVRLRPCADAFSLRGTAWFAAGDRERALADLDRAIQLDPQDAHTRALRALAWSEQGKCARALAEANVAVGADPNLAFAFRVRAQIQQAMGDCPEVIADCTRALAIDPTDVDSLRMRAYARRICGAYSQAISDYDQLLRLVPTDCWAYAYRGYVRGSTGEFEAAIADLNRAVELRSDDATIFILRASVRESQGDAIGAAADHLAALWLEPKSASSWSRYRLPSRKSPFETPSSASSPSGNAEATRSHKPASDSNKPSVAELGKAGCPALLPTCMFDGHCPVTLVEEHRWQPGDAKLIAQYEGRQYCFSSAKNRQKFLANPGEYAALAMGWDLVILIDQGRYVAGDRRHGVFWMQQILLFDNEESLRRFAKDPDRYVQAVYGKNHRKSPPSAPTR